MAGTGRMPKSTPKPAVVDLSSDTDADVDVVGIDNYEPVTIVFENAQTDDEEEEEANSLPDTTTVTVSSALLSSGESTVVCHSIVSEKTPTVTTRNNDTEMEENGIVKIVQLPTSTPPATKSRGGQYVSINDPILDEFIGDILVPPELAQVNEASEENGWNRQDPEDYVGSINSDKANDSEKRIESSQPSTVPSCIIGKKRKGTVSSNSKGEGSSPAKQVRFSDVISTSRDGGSSEERPAFGESDPDSNDSFSKNLKVNKLRKRNRNRQTVISSESTDDESSSSLFEAIIVKKSSFSSTKNKSNNEKRRRFKRVQTKRSKVRDTTSTDSDSSSTNGEKGQGESSNEKMNNLTKESGKGSRRIRRRPAKMIGKKTEKEEAFELLRQRREKMANKPKRPSPERSTTKGSNDEDDDDSDSSYTSGSSPCPIVNNSSPDGSDFDGSTPSSSSVTSSGETDEVPDLESGSDGDKELKTDTKDDKIVNSDDDDESVKSHTSSSEGEPPDDGQNDQRCTLCKNLGSAKIVGRRKVGTLNSPCSWCKCGECQVVSSEVRDYDLVCCREIKNVLDFINEELDDSDVCITKHPRFERDVLNYEAYARSISKHSVPRVVQTSFFGMFAEMHRYGKADYMKGEAAKASFRHSSSFGKMKKSGNSFVRWIFDELDMGRMVIPACVQYKIRQAFGNFEFQTFRPYYICPTGSHCKAAMTSEGLNYEEPD